MKKCLVLLMAVLMILSCAACSSASSGEYPVTLASYTFEKKPESIVCLSDSIADILIACGYGSRISARSDDCTQAEISALPSVGAKDQPHLQKIVEMHPDVVFADKSIKDEIYSQLEEKNIPVLIMMPAKTTSELTMLYENVCRIADGNYTGKENGNEKAKSIIMTMGDLQRLVPKSNVVKKACYLYDIDGNAATERTLAGKLFDYTNTVNICATEDNDGQKLNSLILNDPDYIFCAIGVKSKLKSDSRFANLRAVRADRIYEIDAQLFQRQGNSLTEVLSFLIETMYPELKAPHGQTEFSMETSEESSTREESSTPEESSTLTSEEPSDESSEEASEEASREVSGISMVVTADDSLTITDGLEYGITESGDDVTKIQNRLSALGYLDSEPTGYYGPATQEAVLQFEAANGLDPDGYADTVDLRLLFSADAVPAVERDSN